MPLSTLVIYSPTNEQTIRRKNPHILLNCAKFIGHGSVMAPLGETENHTEVLIRALMIELLEQANLLETKIT